MSILSLQSIELPNESIDLDPIVTNLGETVVLYPLLFNLNALVLVLEILELVFQRVEISLSISQISYLRFNFRDEKFLMLRDSLRPRILNIIIIIVILLSTTSEWLLFSMLHWLVLGANSGRACYPKSRLVLILASLLILKIIGSIVLGWLWSIVIIVSVRLVLILILFSIVLIVMLLLLVVLLLLSISAVLLVHALGVGAMVEGESAILGFALRK